MTSAPNRSMFRSMRRRLTIFSSRLRWGITTGCSKGSTWKPPHIDVMLLPVKVTCTTNAELQVPHLSERKTLSWKHRESRKISSVSERAGALRLRSSLEMDARERRRCRRWRRVYRAARCDRWASWQHRVASDLTNLPHWTRSSSGKQIFMSTSCMHKHGPIRKKKLSPGDSFLYRWQYWAYKLQNLKIEKS